MRNKATKITVSEGLKWGELRIHGLNRSVDLKLRITRQATKTIAHTWVWDLFLNKTDHIKSFDTRENAIKWIEKGVVEMERNNELTNFTIDKKGSESKKKPGKACPPIM